MQRDVVISHQHVRFCNTHGRNVSEHVRSVYRGRSVACWLTQRCWVRSYLPVLFSDWLLQFNFKGLRLEASHKPHVGLPVQAQQPFKILTRASAPLLPLPNLRQWLTANTRPPRLSKSCKRHTACCAGERAGRCFQQRSRTLQCGARCYAVLHHSSTSLFLTPFFYSR